MLHLHFALNFERLADNLTEVIQSCWRDPFDGPVVIFPDRNLEQWFRYRWIERRSVVANLNTKFLENFLFEILTERGGHVKRLPMELLRNVMMAWLTDETNGQPNYRQLGSEVSQYLTDHASGNTRINENRLFDFASIMSGLFLEYESSRPGGFLPGRNGQKSPGLFDCWKPGETLEFFNNSAKEDWQKRLYQTIFQDQNGQGSMLERVFAQMGPDISYQTLPWMFEENKRQNGGNAHFYYESEAPIFLFWHAGMGQFYRVILDEFSKTHEVYAFIQNPCMEFWEDVECFPENIRRKWNTEACPESLRALEYLSVKDGAPDEETPENLSNDENFLLKKWGRAGRDNIRLWCLAAQYDFDFAEEWRETPADAPLLQQVQWMIAHRKNQFQEGVKISKRNRCGKTEYFVDDASLSVTSAPSRIREIEALHSRICHLLNSGVRISDMLIMAPDITAYNAAIHQIFDQNSLKAQEEKASNSKPTVLQIPFKIIDSAAIHSLTYRALNNLFSIRRNQNITRPVFFELVRNPLVQHVRRIQAEEVAFWENWIDSMHIYRDRNAKQDDWKDGVRRLLAAKLSSAMLSPESHTPEEYIKNEDSTWRVNLENVYQPYSDLETGDSASLCRFIDCIEDLENWARNFSETEVKEEDLMTIQEFLNRWISLPDVPRELAGELIVYQHVVDAFDQLRVMYRAGKSGISIECVDQVIRDAAESSDYTNGNLFVNGLTFMSFRSVRTIPVKYLFFIGADEMKFPGSSTPNSLDLRKTKPLWLGDTQPADRNRYGFLCQMMCTDVEFHISYVGKDLQKDKEFYPSSPVSDIRRLLLNALVEASEEKIPLERIWPALEIPLDETRPWTELFTEREMRNKLAFDQLTTKASHAQNSGNALPEFTEMPNESLPDRVSYYQIRSFLEDPFQFYIGRILKEGSLEADPDSIIYEPVSLTQLDKSTLIKQCIKAALTELSGTSACSQLANHTDKINVVRLPSQNQSHPSTHASQFEQKALRVLQQKFIEFKQRGLLPDGLYGKNEADNIMRNINAILEKMLDDLNGTNCILDDHSELELAQPDHLNTAQFDVKPKSCGKRWILQGELSWHTEDGQNIFSVSTHSPKTKQYIPLYVTALYLAAARKDLDDNTNISFTLTIYSPYKSKPETRQLLISPFRAREILHLIYEYAFKVPYIKCVPVSLIENEFEQFSQYEETLTSTGGPWEYFSKKHLFDTEKDLGFTNDENFKNQWNEACAFMKELICFIKSKAKNKDKPDESLVKIQNNNKPEDETPNTNNTDKPEGKKPRGRKSSKS